MGYSKFDVLKEYNIHCEAKYYTFKFFLKIGILNIIKARFILMKLFIYDFIEESLILYI